ncbi:MAG TPA: hypothetical protein ENJ28_00095 [Gammaproteobacteria bacterium]|nr:hypothetical protein [Gammaproteobacteria bacterium]
MESRLLNIIFSASILLFFPSAHAQIKYKCLHIMSYHKGYAWNDGIEKGVEKSLNGYCQLKKFFMDTKRNTSVEFAQEKAKQAQQLISSYQPDIVIASDDNASKYIVTKYKDSKIPFVFNGINWTAKPYGFPYSNVTGMVEVAPIIPMLEIIKRNTPSLKKGIYISADVITEHKDYTHYKEIYRKKGINLNAIFVKSMSQWIKAFKDAQTADFIILNNNAGINDWDNNTAKNTVQTYGKKLTLTNYKWMMPYSMLALTKNAYEQGNWAGEIAKEVLSGTNISDIPITINREWHFYINKALLNKANITIDKNTERNASPVW